jgi:hypothetical protein
LAENGADFMQQSTFITIRMSPSSLYLFVHLSNQKTDNCLIVTFITTNTDGVVFCFFKVLCIVAVIVSAPNWNRHPWSTRASGARSSGFVLILDSV